MRAGSEALHCGFGISCKLPVMGRRTVRCVGMNVAGAAQNIDFGRVGTYWWCELKRLTDFGRLDVKLIPHRGGTHSLIKIQKSSSWSLKIASLVHSNVEASLLLVLPPNSSTLLTLLQMKRMKIVSKVECRKEQSFSVRKIYTRCVGESKRSKRGPCVISWNRPSRWVLGVNM
jgi:hypothetical protein